MSEQPRQMHLGVLLLAAGNVVSGWRMPEAQAGSQNFPLIQQVANTAERGKLDFIFLADAVNTFAGMHPSMVLRLEPLTLLAALAMSTSRIGLAATASTTYTEPYNLARMLASIDHLSGGRVAWNVVTGAFAEAAANFGTAKHPPHEERYAIAEEFVKVAKGLWDSWEEDSFVMDKASGKYVDADKMHVLNHHGKFFQVKGPLNITRPPQGYPVILQAGASDTGCNFAAAEADVVFVVQQNKDAALAFANRLRGLAEQYGRNPAHLKIMPGICPIVGSTEAEARAKLAELGALVDPVYAMKVLSERTGHDMSVFPLDGPVPELPPSTIMQGHAITLAKTARERNMTVRELRDFVGMSMGHKLICGSPEQIADELEDWFRAGAGDGFNLLPPWFPGGMDDFVDHVVPVLQKRGLFRTEYTGHTLREHLGIPRPDHPAKQRAASATGVSEPVLT
ncbi:LLM class flavin-dependent oxidoreductase [Bosea sp. BK604]|uniref:LLM class flavin-dependent oxidoreductase n=1 Tax=Bosea sp. BK604 TaxID=2512180 RepID=UPI00104CF51B|nr:LLM class flavin-dependent oxidoreductase [Bosea sp. BK604]TCR60798.1 FMN-dependent oxidoreductase (nitrilotriacetate monooxygenase family) [Bosea sp. BK604]